MPQYVIVRYRKGKKLFLVESAGGVAAASYSPLPKRARVFTAYEDAEAYLVRGERVELLCRDEAT